MDFGLGGLPGPIRTVSPVPPVVRIDCVGGDGIALAIGEATNAGDFAVGGVSGTGRFTPEERAIAPHVGKDGVFGHGL